MCRFRGLGNMAIDQFRWGLAHQGRDNERSSTATAHSQHPVGLAPDGALNNLQPQRSRAGQPQIEARTLGACMGTGLGTTLMPTCRPNLDSCPPKRHTHRADDGVGRQAWQVDGELHCAVPQPLRVNVTWVRLGAGSSGRATRHGFSSDACCTPPPLMICDTRDSLTCCGEHVLVAITVHCQVVAERVKEAAAAQRAQRSDL